MLDGQFESITGQMESEALTINVVQKIIICHVKILESEANRLLPEKTANCRVQRTCTRFSSENYIDLIEFSLMRWCFSRRLMPPCKEERLQAPRKHWVRASSRCTWCFVWHVHAPNKLEIKHEQCTTLRWMHFELRHESRDKSFHPRIARMVVNMLRIGKVNVRSGMNCMSNLTNKVSSV